MHSASFNSYSTSLALHDCVDMSCFLFFQAIILAAKSAAHAVAYAARKAGVARDRASKCCRNPVAHPLTVGNAEAQIPASRHEAWDHVSPLSLTKTLFFFELDRWDTLRPGQKLV